MSSLIYIPTRGRIGINKQKTLRNFLKYSSHKPILVCPKDEIKQHKSYYKRVVVCSERGIGPTRQWILENSSVDVPIVASDDLEFLWRPDPRSVILKSPCTNLDPIIALCEEIVKDGFIHGGLSQRKLNRYVDFKESRGDRKGLLIDGHVYLDNVRVNDFHFMDRQKVVKAGVRFDELQVMEDFHYTLKLLTEGYPNRVIYDYAWGQSQSGAAGGCSLYRTAKVQEECAKELAKRFPKFVKVVTRKAVSSWKGMEERYDVSVQWARAFKASQK